jgi:glycine/D-amino acid oxidase-like deaminating enzyme
LMAESDTTVDAVIIGGGFYGAAIAIYLAQQRGLKKVVLIEKESKLLARASYNNQARIHNGYHYPRSFSTAYRSRVNLPKFVRDWPQALSKDFTKLYAIARNNSKVTSTQFKRFCNEIGAQIKPANAPMRSLFEPRLVEDVFLVEEYAFDSAKLAQWAEVEMRGAGIHVQLETTATEILRGSISALKVVLQAPNRPEENIRSRYVFNCSYSGINQIRGSFPGTRAQLKHEITEMALIQVPDQLSGFGITVMDGPFFSIMPFPSRGLHTLSHVRFTPRLNWLDELGVDPYLKLSIHDRASRVDRMIRDVARYLPSISNATHVDSLFEVKTVLVKNETDDGRPILFEKHAELPGCYSILGGKLDNVYDVLERLDEEPLSCN